MCVCLIIIAVCMVCSVAERAKVKASSLFFFFFYKILKCACPRYILLILCNFRLCLDLVEYVMKIEACHAECDLYCISCSEYWNVASTAVSSQAMQCEKQYQLLRLLPKRRNGSSRRQLSSRLAWKTMIPKKTSVSVDLWSCHIFLVRRWRFACLEMPSMWRRWLYHSYLVKLFRVK